MARSITEIQNGIFRELLGDTTLGPQLTSLSRVSIWRLWTYVVSVSIWALENLYDIFRIETDEKIAALKPHSLRWYALKAKAFQYGYDLVTESDYYDNTGLDEDTIEASQIVAHAAVIEQIRGLRIKVAKNVGTDLGPLNSPQIDAFTEYMKRVKDAGVKLLITTAEPDSLKLTVDIYYNPLVLNSDGGRNDGASSEPVQDAVKQYLKNLPFNGILVLQNLVDVLQVVDGVQVVDIKNAQAQYGALPYTAFRVQYVPDAGYLRIVNPADLVINFLPY